MKIGTRREQRVSSLVKFTMRDVCQAARGGGSASGLSGARPKISERRLELRPALPPVGWLGEDEGERHRDIALIGRIKRGIECIPNPGSF